MANENVENSITVTIVGNGVGTAAAAVASQIAAVSAANPTVAAGLAYTKMTMIAVGAETLTVAIAVQSGDPDRIGSASTAAIGSILAALVVGAVAATVGAGVIVTAVAVGFGGAWGTKIGKQIWEGVKDGVDAGTLPPSSIPDFHPICTPTDTDGNGIPDYIEDIKKKFNKATTTRSPIVLDLNGDGITTTAVTAGAYFDHDGNGFAEATGWVNAQDGILVRDINGNGTIDTGRELFGSETLLANGQKAENGYQALAELDTNHDGQINQQDAAYATLEIWKTKRGQHRISF